MRIQSRQRKWILLMKDPKKYDSPRHTGLGAGLGLRNGVASTGEGALGRAASLCVYVCLFVKIKVGK